MKKTMMGGFIFLGGCILFSGCMLYNAFEGCVPSDVQGEKLLSIVMLILGAGLMVVDALKDKMTK